MGRREAQKENKASAAVATAVIAGTAAITATAAASTTDIIGRGGLITVTVFHGRADKPKARLSPANIALLYTTVVEK